MSVDPDGLKAQGDDARLLQAAFAGFETTGVPDRIGVAVSGGGDSMALLHIFARLAAQMGNTLHAVTVDHGLRPAAKDEARFVAGVCAELGVSHQILEWHRTESTGNLQDQARRARYRLIADWAVQHDIADVTIGHTRDDQAETFLMRLGRSSGVDGLSGMRRHWSVGSVRFHRPLLGVSRSDLRDELRRNGLEWIEDPSNDDPGYDRVKARKALVALQPLGITTETLSEVAHHLSMARGALDAQCMAVADKLMVLSHGDVVLWRDGFAVQHPEIIRRLLARALVWVASADYPPRAAALAGLEQAIANGQDKTLGGCRMIVTDTEIRISRELRAVRGTVTATDALWDGRWRCEGPHEPGLTLRALGPEGLRECPNWRAAGLPRTSLLATPAIWRNETLIAAPVAGLGQGWTVQIDADFHSTAFAH